MQNAELRNLAAKRKAESLAGSEPHYRDRAAERRIALGQPEMPLPDSRFNPNKRPRYEAGPPPPPPPPVQPNRDGIEDSNVGHRMLQAAGWSKGEGLGSGAGRVDPVSARMFIGGAGIGASTGDAILPDDGPIPL